MNNPKTYFIVLLLCSLLVLVILWLKPDTKPELFQARVVSQTLTQSLDGHRRYLNVITDNNQSLLLQSDPKLDCPKDSHITIQQDQSFFSDHVSYTVIKCFQLQYKE
ncbi:hypothetical protein AKJ18_07350 [Vibrio xuii]|nr:hypothetical protein AKJ18_07350 [Vibrio xuii]